jgi:hypothetical protein
MVSACSLIGAAATLVILRYSRPAPGCSFFNSQLAFGVTDDNVEGRGRLSMDGPKNIARLNIEHYRRLLATETDPSKRAMVEKLLAEEQAKLRALEAERKRDGSA